MPSEHPEWLRRFLRLAKDGQKSGTVSGADCCSEPKSGALGTGRSAAADSGPTVPWHHAEIGYETDEWVHIYDECIARRDFDWRLRPQQAEELAYEDLRAVWHRRHIRHVASYCAGCGDPITEAEAQQFSDGALVHAGRPGCAPAYGKQWRRSADRRLHAAGVRRLRPHLVEKENMMNSTKNAPGVAKDDRADPPGAWLQGYADGRKGIWDTRLADDEDPVGHDYLDGWMAGNESRKAV